MKELYFQQPWNCPTSGDVGVTNDGVDVALSERDVSVSGDMLMGSEAPLPAAALAAAQVNGTQEEIERLCLAHLASYRLLPLVKPSSTNEEEGGVNDSAVNPLSVVDEEGLTAVKEENKEKNDDEVVVDMVAKLVIDEQGRETVKMVPKQDQPTEQQKEQQPAEQQKGKQPTEPKLQHGEKGEGIVVAKEAEENKGGLVKGADDELMTDDETAVDGTPTVVVDGRVDVDVVDISSRMTSDDGAEALSDVAVTVVTDIDGDATATVTVTTDAGIGIGGGGDDDGSDVGDGGKGDQDEWADEWAGFEDHDEAVEEAPVDSLVSPEEDAVVAGTKSDQSESEAPPEPNSEPVHALEETLESNPDSKHERKLEAKGGSVVERDEVVMTPAVEVSAKDKEVVVEEMEKEIEKVKEKEDEKDKDKDEKEEEIETKVATEEGTETDTKLLPEELDRKDTEEGDATAAHLEIHDKNYDQDLDQDKHDGALGKPDMGKLSEGDLVSEPRTGLEDVTSDADIVEDHHNHHRHNHDDEEEEEEEEDEEDESETTITTNRLETEAQDSERNVDEGRGDRSKEGVTVLVPIATIPISPFSDIFSDGMSSIGDHFMVRLFHQRKKAHRNSLEFHFLMVAAATVFLYALAALAVTCSLLVSM